MKPKRWIRYPVTFVFPNGAAGAALVQGVPLCLEGEILNIHQVNSANVGNRTAQLTLEDADAFVTFDGTGKAANTTFDHEFGVTIRRILSGKNTLKCTISGDPGAGGFTINAVISLYGRDG